MKMVMNVSKELNLIAICGQNNVGKTNTLRAINCFFHPEEYDDKVDMPTFKRATGGQSIYTKIEITFWDNQDDTYYRLCRNMKPISETENDFSLSGTKYKLIEKKPTNKQVLSPDECKCFLEKIEFVYIETANIFMPDMMRKITEGIINLEYNKARFSNSKKNLKKAYDTYIDGLRGILGTFAEDISSTFKAFRDNWKVEFNVPKNSETFRDLISEDVRLLLNDNGSIGVLDKGAGLQRLATILLNFEMLSRIDKKKSIIVCIDEPDVYLHEGLQRKLKELFDDKSERMQLFFTTHSRVFIDESNMRNVFLLHAEHRKQYSVRKKKDIDIVESILVDIDDKGGYDKICDHLGIQAIKYELLKEHNILVEGNCDKTYLSELFNYFGLPLPNIESVNGVANMQKCLDFYDSYYYSRKTSYKPIIKVLLDNDPTGKDAANRIKQRTYKHIDVIVIILRNHENDANLQLAAKFATNAIEDFMYPEVIIHLMNRILKNREMKKLNIKAMCDKIHTPSLAAGGILDLCDHEKNIQNPETGALISLKSQSIKESLAKLFKLQEGNDKELIEVMRECDIKYPFVKEFITELSIFS